MRAAKILQRLEVLYLGRTALVLRTLTCTESKSLQEHLKDYFACRYEHADAAYDFELQVWIQPNHPLLTAILAYIALIHQLNSSHAKLCTYDAFMETLQSLVFNIFAYIVSGAVKLWQLSQAFEARDMPSGQQQVPSRASNGGAARCIR